MKNRLTHSLFVLLCFSLLLSACSKSNVDTPASKAPVTSPEESITLPQEYDTIITNIINAYPWNDDDTSVIPENPELSYLYRRNSALSDIGFALIDLDNNGQQELLISDPKQDYVYDLFTLSNGQAVHLFASGERSRYYVRENGFVEHQWSGGAGLTGHDFYKLENGILSFVERITLDVQHAVDLGIIADISQANEVDTYFRSNSTQHEDYQAISSDEADSTLKAYQAANTCVTMEYTLLSSCKNHSAESSDSHVLITQHTDLTYSYEITDYSGRTIAHVDDLIQEPRRQYVSTDVVGICLQAGTGLSTNYAVYYDLKNGVISETFQYVLAAKNDFVVYADCRNGEHFIIAQNIFDKDRYYTEHQLENVSPVAADCAIDGYFDAQGNVIITYLTGEDYTETRFTIEILPKNTAE